MGIKYILINETLKDFYSIHKEKGKGVITNHKGGAFAYDLFEETQGKIADNIDSSIKSERWKFALKELAFYYKNIEMSPDKKLQIRTMIYKALLLEYYLNWLLTHKDKIWGYVGDELPKILGTKEDLQKLREYKNDLEMGIFSLSPDE